MRGTKLSILAMVGCIVLLIGLLVYSVNSNQLRESASKPQIVSQYKPVPAPLKLDTAYKYNSEEPVLSLKIDCGNPTEAIQKAVALLQSFEGGKYTVKITVDKLED